MNQFSRLTLLLGFASAGCFGYAGSGDDDDASCAPAPYACPIEQPECAVAILQLTACERGDGAAALPMIVRLTGSEYGERTRRKLEQDGVSSSPWDPVLRALGLLPMGEALQDAAIGQAVENVAAFYDFDTKEIGIITDATSGLQDPRERMLILSHELTHYLQDGAHDLQKRRSEAVSLDRAMALGMLIEGEAVVNSTRVLLDITRKSRSEFSFPDYFNRLETTLLQGIVQAPSPLAAAAQSLPYWVGGRYVARLWDEQGHAAVDALYDAAPMTAAEWLRQGTGLGPDERLACAPPPPPEGFQLYELDHFGATGVVAMLGSIDDTVDFDLGGALSDDAIALYVQQGAADPASAPSIGIWRLRFRSAGASERFFALFEKRNVGLRRAGSDLLMRVSSDPALAEWQASELEACPSPEQITPMHAEPMPPSAALKRVLGRW